MWKVITAIFLLPSLVAFSAHSQQLKIPTPEDFLAMSEIFSAEISPDGNYVAYREFHNDFEADKDIYQLWLAPTRGSSPVQLTFDDNAVEDYEWSADSQWLAFIRNDKLHFINAHGGEALVAKVDAKGISALHFAPDNSALYFTAVGTDRARLEAREKRYGNYEVYREDGNYKHIWQVALDKHMRPVSEPRQLTDGRDFSVSGFSVSPDGKQIAFATWASPHIIDLDNGHIYAVNTTGGKPKLLDGGAGRKGVPVWHTSGDKLAYTNGLSFYDYSDVEIRDIGGANVKKIDMIKYNPGLLRFDKNGLTFEAGLKTTQHLYRLDPSDGDIKALTSGNLMTSGYTFSRDGKQRAYLANGDKRMTEVMVASNKKSQQLTNNTAQLKDFTLPQKQLIQWKSYDGLEIEGILTRPYNYQPGKKYPLYVVTHGGPAATDRPSLRYATWLFYQPEVLAAEGGGAFVLQTNYRGSANYGEAFQSSNLKNLGVGPAEDIKAGVKTLQDQDLIDADRVACLGWSEGGIISAMLATYTDICTAAIMGAGISDWRTYYYNTDITQFTLNYLGATPLADDAIYAKTSPVTYIDRAKTPVLIQHGDKDQRVPIANGFQLRQLLLDKGVESRMVIYKDMGHIPHTPRLRRAINDHAIAWFREFLFGAERAEFVFPVEAEKE